MFKSATIYRIAGSLNASRMNPFAPTQPTQEKSIGWIPPREENGALIESVAGQQIIKLAIETRSVPAATIKEEVEKACAAVEQETGRKPGKKERRDIADEVKFNLLPSAFPKRVHILGWIDPEAGLLVIDCTSTSRLDDFAKAVVEAGDGVVLQPLNTKQSPVGVMSVRLLDPDLDSVLWTGWACQLESMDDSKRKVKYANCYLDTDEIKDYIRAGMAAVKLEFGFEDVVTFTLNESGSMSQIGLDVEYIGEEADAFDVDVSLFTKIMQQVIPALIHELGGLEEAA